jgi:hypothetical protein
MSGTGSTWRARFAAVGLAIAALAAPTGAFAESNSVRSAQTQARSVAPSVPDDTSIQKAAEVPVSAPFRGQFGHASLYLPTFFHPTGGTYDVIFHFHGLNRAQETNIERAQVNAAVVSVNIGIGSDPYEKAFMHPGAFDALVRNAARMIASSGRAEGATVGRIALSAWSAGFGAVSAILRSKSPKLDQVDAVFLADGLHAGYKDEKAHTVEPSSLFKYAKIADAAKRGEKLFVLTHSAIPTVGYPSTTETIGELIRIAGAEKTRTGTEGPRGMREIYETNVGDFHVKGYEGQGVKDHIDHIWGMGDTMYPYLRARWTR